MKTINNACPADGAPVRRCRRSVALGLLASTAAAAATVEARGDALHDHDNSPLSALFGLPDATEGGALVERGRGAWTVLAQVASHSVADAGGGDLLIVDGETSRLELTYRHGVGDRWELGFELPFVTHQAGSLDSVIDEWHEIFGLPDGARDNRPRDVLEFLYRQGGRPGLEFTESSHGLGDIRLTGAYRLSGGPDRGTALRFGIKLPSGDAQDLLGSGATDVSLGLAGDRNELGGSGRWSAFWRLHGVWTGEPDVLADLHEEFVVTAAGGVSWRASEAFTLTVQGSARSALFDSPVDALGEPAFALIVGGAFRLSERLRLDIAVGEDVKVESTPDVTFQLALRYRP